MKYLLLTAAIIITSCIIVIVSPAELKAQDFYTGLEHTPQNHYRVVQYHQQQELALTKLNAYMAVLSMRYHHDKCFHMGRLTRTREQQIYNDVLCIQLQEKAITRAQRTIRDMDEWLKYY